MEKSNEAVNQELGEKTSSEQAATQETNTPVETIPAAAPAAAEAGKQETNEPDIDYEAELRRAEAERDNYKQGMLNAKDELKRRKAAVEPAEPVQADEPSAIDLIRQAVREEVAPLRTEMLTDTVANLVGGITNNPAEQKLVLFHYHNTINKSGTSKDAIIRDLQMAQAIANQGRLRKERDEALLAAKNKQGLRNTSMGANQNQAEPDVLSSVKFTVAEMELIQRSAARANMTVEEYIKKNLPQLKS